MSPEPACDICGRQDPDLDKIPGIGWICPPDRADCQLAPTRSLHLAVQEETPVDVLMRERDAARLELRRIRAAEAPGSDDAMKAAVPGSLS